MSFTLAHFTPRVLTEGVRNVGNAQAALLTQRVFKTRNTHVTDTIDFGEISDNIKLSGYRRPGAPAVPVDLLTGKLNTVQAPSIRLLKHLDEAFHKTLAPGVPGYVGPYTDPNTQIAGKITEEQLSLRRRIDRQIEVSSADVLLDGSATITYPDGGTDTISVNYCTDGGDANTVQTDLSGTDLWSSSGADPMKIIENLAGMIYDYSSWEGQVEILMGYNALRYFVNHSKVQKLIDKEAWGEIATLSAAERACWKGRVGNFDFWSDRHSYQNSAGTRVATWDPDTIAVIPAGGPREVFSVEFGAVFDNMTPQSETLEFIQTQYFSKIAIQQEPPAKDLIVEARPVCVIKMPTAIRIQKVA